jgi:hypothetical protein
MGRQKKDAACARLYTYFMPAHPIAMESLTWNATFSFKCFTFGGDTSWRSFFIGSTILLL